MASVAHAQHRHRPRGPARGIDRLPALAGRAFQSSIMVFWLRDADVAMWFLSAPTAIGTRGLAANARHVSLKAVYRGRRDVRAQPVNSPRARAVPRRVDRGREPAGEPILGPVRTARRRAKCRVGVVCQMRPMELSPYLVGIFAGSARTIRALHALLREPLSHARSRNAWLFTVERRTRSL